MAGPAIAELREGVQRLVEELQLDPQALETARLAIITFSRTAKLASQLTDVGEFTMPNLSVRTGTALGAALRLLNQSIKQDVKRTTSSTKGDFRPLVFLFSDGEPTDSWEEAANALKNQEGVGVANIYAFCCGPDSDPATLRQITDIIFTLRDLSHDVWQKLFIWISASISAASVSAARNSDELTLRLPDIPSDVIQHSTATKRVNAPPRQLFLHSRCSKDGRPYLMRFLRRDSTQKYEAIAAHPLEALEKDADSVLPPVNSSDLVGVPTCPFCLNVSAMVCDCSTVICFSGDSADQITCPTCGQPGTSSTSSIGFDIRQVQG